MGKRSTGVQKRFPAEGWRKSSVESSRLAHDFYVPEGASQLHIILCALWRHRLRVTMPTGSAKESVSSPILGVK